MTAAFVRDARKLCINDLRIVDYDQMQKIADWKHIVCADCIAPIEQAIAFHQSLLAVKRWMRALKRSVIKR